MKLPRIYYCAKKHNFLVSYRMHNDDYSDITDGIICEYFMDNNSLGSRLLLDAIIRFHNGYYVLNNVLMYSFIKDSDRPYYKLLDSYSIADLLNVFYRHI